MEEECHSAWLNAGALKFLKINDETPDIAPGYSYYERDEDGHLTGCIKEMTMMPILAMTGKMSRKKMTEGVLKLVGFLSQHGVTAIYDAGCFIDEEKISVSYTHLYLRRSMFRILHRPLQKKAARYFP